MIHQPQNKTSLAAGAAGLLLAAMFGMAAPSPAKAAAGDEYLGLWKLSNGDAVLRATRCKPRGKPDASALCITVVYDSAIAKAGDFTPLECNQRIAQFDIYDNGQWKSGWAFDRRTRKVYRATLDLDSKGVATARMFVGSAGRNETFQRTDNVPFGCEGRRPGGRTSGEK